MAFDFIKKVKLPRTALFSLGQSASVVGIDIGVSAVKVVQLRKESERAILETYGELKTAPYLKTGEGKGEGFLRYQDAEIIAMLSDILREANVTTKRAVTAVPAISSFVTMMELPVRERSEIASAVQFEARKYVPIPLPEVMLDWQIIDEGDEKASREKTKVLLVAVPREVAAKFSRIFRGVDLVMEALEIETFSLVRSLIGHERLVTALVNIGAQSTTIAIVDQGVVMLSHNIEHGSNELTQALSRGLGITTERAEAFKEAVGLSERPEDREVASVMIPLVEVMLAELDRIIGAYNRRTDRRVEKVNLTGGGSRLRGLVDYTAKRLGVEVVQGFSFSRVTYPAFLQPILKDIGPTFSVAVGLALRAIAIR